MQAEGFRDESPRIAAANAVVIGVSPDSEDALHRFREKLLLPFHLLSDTDHAVAQKYGAWGEKLKVPAPLGKVNGKSHMGIIRSHFVLDENGRILDARIKVSPEDSIRLAVEAVAK